MTHRPGEHPQIEAALVLSAAALFSLIFTVFLLVQPSGDLGMHLRYAAEMQSVADIKSPHFLLQLVLKVFAWSHMHDKVALALILGACYGGMALLIAREIEQRGIPPMTVHPLLFVPALLLASHIFLATLPRENLYHGYFVPVVYHNPTQQLNKLFGLWIWFRFFRHFVERPAAAWPQAAVTGVLCVLSALAKPSFLIAFLPVAALAAVRSVIRRQWSRASKIAVGVGLPSAAVLAWQAWFTYGSEATSSIMFAPFAVFDAGETLYKLPLSLAFPIVVAVVAWRAGEWNARLGGVALFTALALFVTLFLAESENTSDGNFAWTGQTAVFLAYVESALFLAARGPQIPWRTAAWSVFGLHVVAGIIWAAAVAFPDYIDLTG